MTNPAAILVPGMARVWLAPVGTTAPADPVTDMPDGWLDVGYFDPASLQWQTSPSFQTVTSHQSAYPTRRFVDSDAATVTCNLQEWNAINLQTVYGGGEITTMHGTAPEPTTWYKYEPPAITDRTQTACCIEIIDGSKHYRQIIPITEQDSGATVSYHRTAESTLPLSLAVIGTDVGDPWYSLSDDPAMAPVS
ncbi:MAG TPA: hypothetical protein VGG54_22710 [Trebonia sp.]